MDIQYGVGFTPPASKVRYDGTNAGLSATDVQEAIDEVVGMVPGPPPIPHAEDVHYDNTGSSLAADNAQDALDELAAEKADGDAVYTKGQVDALLNPFALKPIGEIFLLQDNLDGCPVPSNAGAQKFIKLTEGLHGAGQFNAGLLGAATTLSDYEDERGHGGVSITAEILVGPMAGERIELINSSEAFIGPRATAGVLTHDQFQGHWHEGYSGGQGTNALGSNGRVISTGTSGTGPWDGMVRNPINDGVNAEPRTGTRTIPKTYSATAYMRIA